MPIRYWRHQCPGLGEHLLASAQPCACGRPVVYDGWSNTRDEAMAWFQNLFGLKATGFHASWMWRVLDGAAARCVSCSGRGYFDEQDHRSCAPCPNCHGAGYTLALGADGLAARRGLVLEKYPDAAAPADLRTLEFAELVHGQRIDVRVERPLAMAG